MRCLVRISSDAIQSYWLWPGEESDKRMRTSVAYGLGVTLGVAAGLGGGLVFALGRILWLSPYHVPGSGIIALRAVRPRSFR